MPPLMKRISPREWGKHSLYSKNMIQGGAGETGTIESDTKNSQNDTKIDQNNTKIKQLKTILHIVT